MLQTAYTLGLEPKLPLHQFKTLVKIECENGVGLIKGEGYLYLFLRPFNSMKAILLIFMGGYRASFPNDSYRALLKSKFPYI